MPVIKTVDGIEIAMYGNDGKFTAEIDGRVVKRSSLAAIEKVITGRRKAITVHVINEYDKHRSEVQIIGVEKNGRGRGPDGALLSKYDRDFLLLSVDEVRKIDSMTKEFEDLQRRWADLINSCKTVTHKNIQQIMAARAAKGEGDGKI